MDGKKSRFKRIGRIVLFLLAAVALTSMVWDDYQRDDIEPPAARLLPDLEAYRQIEGAALLAGQPQLAVTIGVLDQMADCYQEVGGVRARAYSRSDNPLKAGLVAIVDESIVNDPDTLFRCVTPAALNLEETGEVVIEPCTGAYTLVNEAGEFHIIYAASDYSVCLDFCSSLAGCAVHSPMNMRNHSLPKTILLL